MAGKEYHTPLRYPGGKAKFSFYIKEIVECNDLSDGHYVEPFAGGAGVALGLLYSDYVSDIHINDLDFAVYSFWDCAVNSSEELCERILETPVTIDTWLEQKKILATPHAHTRQEIGFATFFLNRVNRSGILKAGVIGGKAQAGKWKLDVRFNKLELIKRIKKIASYKDRIHVYNFDAVDMLVNFTPSLPKKTLVYLDPPYYINGAGLYRNFYGHEDHVLIAEVLKNVDKPWIVSYDNVEQIRDIYKDFRQDQYFLSYTAQEKKRGSEVMIYGPEVIIPNSSISSINTRFAESVI